MAGEALYLAPMEGITGYVFRQVYHRHFPAFDRCFTPFLTPHTKRSLNTRESREVDPERNRGYHLIPQILSNDAEGFLETAKKLKALGYREVNLNLGCPSRTVTGRGRGSGFLREPEKLDLFFQKVFADPPMSISIKTRLGFETWEEIRELAGIFERYPFTEWILHPRVAADLYRGRPRLEAFDFVYREGSVLPLCYNGDLQTREDLEEIRRRYPSLAALMVGRGILQNPFLLEEDPAPGDGASRLEDFLEDLLLSYGEEMSGERPVLYKLKEVFSYLGRSFPGGEKQLKRIRKAESLEGFRRAYRALLTEIPFRPPRGLSPWLAAGEEETGEPVYF